MYYGISGNLVIVEEYGMPSLVLYGVDYVLTWLGTDNGTAIDIYEMLDFHTCFLAL